MAFKITVVLAYIAMIVAIGIIGLKKTRSFTDFFLGGRDVGPWLTAFTYGTAYFSAVLFIGFAGKIGWAFGLSAIWVAIGNTLIGTLGVWLILGKRIKQETVSRGVHTMPEYLDSRYNSKFLKYYSAVAIFVFLIPYTAAVFMGLSYLFEANFGLPYWAVLVFMGLFTAVYLVLGGYKSMTMVDFIFGMIMIIGVGVLLASCIIKGNGISGIVSQLRAIDPRLVESVGPPGIWPLFSIIFLTSVAPFAMPQLIQKFYAIRDDRSVKIGTIVSTVFALIVTGTAYFTGSLTRIFLSPAQNPSAFTANGSPNFDSLMPELLTYAIPNSLSVIILLLMLSASMSTLAALVLISSSTIVKDLYGGLAHERTTDRRSIFRFLSAGKRASDKRLIILMRIMTGVFVLLSVILAFLRPSVIVTILSISWGAVASVFLGPFIWGLLTKRAGKAGAIISSICGLGTCLTLFFVWGGPRASEAGAIGMMVSLGLGLLLVPFAKKEKA
ncbi:sodium:solute symporter [bacterium]|nr:sodium:solute symporter [bacterium]